MITRKSREQIALMRKAGRVVAEMHEVCIRAAKPGATTADIDEAARDVLDRRGARSNFLGYGNPPFPGVVCTSPNEVIVHGIPSKKVVLQEGDILSIDCGAIIEGWHADAAVTVPVGEIAKESQRLLEVTRASLDAAIEHVTAANRLGDIGAAIGRIGKDAGLGTNLDFGGHGIGRRMHEDPHVPNGSRPGRGLNLRAGHVFAIEPWFWSGPGTTYVIDPDGWTLRSADRTRGAHAEHTVAITPNGPEILTLP